MPATTTSPSGNRIASRIDALGTAALINQCCITGTKDDEHAAQIVNGSKAKVRLEEAAREKVESAGINRLERVHIDQYDENQYQGQDYGTGIL
jgi:hypothetical protein